jgi:hypothetical protein
MKYAESAPVNIELVPTDQLPLAIREFEDAADEYRRQPTDDLTKEAPPRFPVRALQIDIRVAQTALQKYGLRLKVDPDIAEGDSDWYSVQGSSGAWAICATTVGDADIYLYEEGVAGVRGSSIRGGTAADDVSADMQATGNWSLQVYGFRSSTYTLSGLFVAL